MVKKKTKYVDPYIITKYVLTEYNGKEFIVEACNLNGGELIENRPFSVVENEVLDCLSNAGDSRVSNLYVKCKLITKPYNITNRL